MKIEGFAGKTQAAAVQKAIHAPHIRSWRPHLALPACCLILLLLADTTRAATHNVQVGGPEGPYFYPAVLEIQPGDTVKWTWFVAPHAHTVSSKTGLFDTPERVGPYNFSYTFANAGEYHYYCKTHVGVGFDATGVVYVGMPAPVSSAQPLNVSTRLRVQTGQNAMIGGFIVTGNVPKRVMVRAIGPSLAGAGVTDALADPTMTLLAAGNPIASNDNWEQSQRPEIRGTGIPPSDEREAAIIATLSPGSYTAIVEGKDGASGVGLVEVYDLDQPADSKLANISTRGVVGTGSDVMIGGFILGNKSGAARMMVRAIGPSLTAAGISGALGDPTLELRNGNGDSIGFNNNWRDRHEAELQQTTIPPSEDLEAAIVAELPPGAYTAVVAGNGETTGVAVVEAYVLDKG